MNKNILLLLTSTAFGGLVSMLINFYQWKVKAKRDADEEERERLFNDVKYYRNKFRADENEIDRLKEEIRKLKAAQVSAAEKKGDFNE